MAVRESLGQVPRYRKTHPKCGWPPMHWDPRLSKIDRVSSSIPFSADWVPCDPASSSCIHHTTLPTLPQQWNVAPCQPERNASFLLSCPGCALPPQLLVNYFVTVARKSLKPPQLSSVPRAWRSQQVPVAFSVFSSFQWDFAYFHFLNFRPV